MTAGKTDSIFGRKNDFEKTKRKLKRFSFGKTIFKRNAFRLGKTISEETIFVFGKNGFRRNDIEIKTPQASRGAVSDKFTNSYEENLKNPK